MPSERELLAAILADPDDDPVRLVYADWLLERGDRRGEYISLMVRAAQHDRWDPERVALEQHARRVFVGMKRPKHMPARHVWYHRGLLSAIASPLDELLAAPAVIEQAPVTELYGWRAQPGELTRLGGLPSVRRLRHLRIHGWLADEVARFLDGPGRAVRSIRLEPFGTSNLSQLAAALTALPALDGLGLTGLKRAEWAPLVEAGVVRRATTIWLGHGNEDPEALMAAAGAVTTLRAWWFGALHALPSLAGVRDLALETFSPEHPDISWPLEQLSIRTQTFPDQLVRSGVLRSLKALRLREHLFTESQLDDVVAALGPSLCELTLEGPGRPLLLALARRAESLPNLASIAVQHVRLSDAHARILAEAPFPSLRRLSLRHSSVENGAGLDALDRRFGPLRHARS